ncbi:potassium channel family protein [Aurantimonas marianensis]|uniref:Potassium channel family protein n=1 Tax=Aurantimonas marianensis TaxID=2920428 RepID=A0A9X2HCA8_9HYPH|nr:potassium channel family protein [Aurantimonas marianensis]MCP3057003.1 potassium channel family protein [Aurantimonas marianensis]
MDQTLSVLLIVAGSALVVVTIVDAIGGFFRIGASAGILTRPFEDLVSRVVLWWVRRSRNRNQLNLLGAYCVATRTVVSVTMLWLGWSLLYVSSEEAAVIASSGAIASTLERFYFAGYVVSTLGLGDIKPGNDTWRMVTTFASLSGFLFLTFVVSFMVTIASQISQRRSVAMAIISAGDGPYAVLERYRSGDIVDLGPLVSLLALPVITSAEASTNLPLLHRFHTSDTLASYAVAIARLNETLTILEHGCKSDPDPQIALLRHGIDMIADSLPGQWRDDAVAAPPALTPLRASGFICASDDAFADAMVEARVRYRRNRLKNMVETLGFSWDRDVYRNAGDSVLP